MSLGSSPLGLGKTFDTYRRHIGGIFDIDSCFIRVMFDSPPYQVRVKFDDGRRGKTAEEEKICNNI
jgi:hypothetical protein